MALDDSEEDEEEEEEEGTDMESDLEKNKDDGNWAISFIFRGFVFLSYHKSTNMHDGSLQISLMKWPGAPRRSYIMTPTMWQPVRIADLHRRSSSYSGICSALSD